MQEKNELMPILKGKGPTRPSLFVCPFLPFSQIPSRDAVSRRITRHLSVRLMRPHVTSLSAGPG